MNYPVDESFPDDTPEYPLSAPIKPDDPERQDGDGEEDDMSGPA